MAFERSTYAFGNSKRRTLTVDVQVDGQSLYGMVEGQGGAADGVPGLSLAEVAAPSLHFLGSPNMELCDEGRAVVLDCECGHWRCGAVLADITVTDEIVTWSRIGRIGDEPQLGPFLFDRQQYEAALSALTAT